MATKKKGTVVTSSAAKKTAKKKTRAKKAAKKSVNKKSVTCKTDKSKTINLPADAGIRQQMIAEAAYFLSVQRCFEEGSALQDWLTAEAQVDRELTRQKD